MKKKKFKKVRIPILNDEYFVYVIWGDEKKRLKWLRWYFDDDSIIPDDWPLNRATTHFNKKGMPVINIHDHKYFYAELAHEAVHAVDWIFNYINDGNRGELFAHSVGAVIRAVEKFQNK